MQDLVGWAGRFISTPSVSRDGNHAVANLAADLLSRVGLSVRLQPVSASGPIQINVIGEAGPRTGHDLLLLTHLDTVPPGDGALWTATGGDPFAPTRDGDRLYGLGSADAKVDLVCKAFALATIDFGALRRGLRVVGTFGEEIGLRGARSLVENGGTEGIEFGLVGEPSELVGIRAHKGYTVFEARIPLRPVPDANGGQVSVDVTGESVHSSTPQLGRNAIEGAIERMGEPGVQGIVDARGGDAVNRVPDHCRLELVIDDVDPAPSGPVLDPAPLLSFLGAWRALLADLESPRDADFDPDHTVGNLGCVEIEGKSAVVTFDLRPVPGIDPEQAVEPLTAHARISCVRSNPPLDTSEDSPLVRVLRNAQSESGMKPAIGTKATCTEAGLLSAAGVDALVFGPGTSVGNVHRPNEHTRISDLERAVEIYRSLVHKLCVEEPCSS